MALQLSKQLRIALPFALLILSSTLHAQDPTMVLFFSFDDATGPEVEDHSQFMNNGTLEGDPEFVPGQFGTALNFDATDDQVVVPGNATLDIVDEITMMAWIRPGPNLMADWRTIMGKSPTSVLGQTTFSYDIRTDNTGVLRFSLNIGGWQSIRGPILVEDTWYHVTGTRVGQEMTLYLDGEPIGTTSASGSIVVTPDPLVVGNIVTAAGNTLNEFWTGVIDEVRIWNRGISAEEVKTNMVQGKEALIRNPFASGPDPADGQPDSPRDDVVLSWNSGVTAEKHNVYFGTLFDDVSDASTADAKGVLVSQGQDASTFDPGRLEFDQ
ncbi:MAG: LamG domain-containing protein, partial [Planctomycetes bacterium]|nr:LamG domain-containing protein [Planctomycetota bacterium]